MSLRMAIGARTAVIKRSPNIALRGAKLSVRRFLSEAVEAGEAARTGSHESSKLIRGQKGPPASLNVLTRSWVVRRLARRRGRLLGELRRAPVTRLVPRI